MSLKAKSKSVETYAYLNHVTSNLLRPYLKEVMQQAGHANRIAAGTTRMAPTVTAKKI